MRSHARRAPIVVRAGLDRQAVWRAGDREVVVVAACLALGWRGRAGGGHLGLAQPLYVLDRTPGRVRCLPVVDLALGALLVAAAAWSVLFGGGRPRRGRG